MNQVEISTPSTKTAVTRNLVSSGEVLIRSLQKSRSENAKKPDSDPKKLSPKYAMIALLIGSGVISTLAANCAVKSVRSLVTTTTEVEAK